MKEKGSLCTDWTRFGVSRVPIGADCVYAVCSTKPGVSGLVTVQKTSKAGWEGKSGVRRRTAEEGGTL